MDYLNRMHKNALTVELKESLDDEIWQPTDIPTEYYDSLHYLITGESLNLRSTFVLKKETEQGPTETSLLSYTTLVS